MLKEGWSNELVGGKLHYFVFNDTVPKGGVTDSLCGGVSGPKRSSLRLMKYDEPLKCEKCKRLLEKRRFRRKY